MTKKLIVSLSLPKSGTTTLAVALRHSGLRVADWRIRRHETTNTELQNQLIAPMMYEDYFKSGDPFARLGEFDAFTEINAINMKLCYWPQTDSGMLAAIEKHHPGTRFVLSLRDPAKVVNSISNWNNLGSLRLPRNDVPGLPRPYGETPQELTRWIEGHYAFCERMFRGCDNFLAYELEAPDVNITLSKFLDIDVKWWGEANTTASWVKTRRNEG